MWCFTTVVPDRVPTIIITIKTPGLVVESKQAVITLSSPCDSSVCHSYNNTLLSSPPPSNSGQSDPLYTTPGTWSQISLGGQDTTDPLQPSITSLWSSDRERRLLGCVWVQCESTGIWRDNKTWLGGWRSGRFPVFRSVPVHEPKPVWLDANRLNRHLSWRHKSKSIPDPTCIVLVISRMTRWWSWCDV